MGKKKAGRRKESRWIVKKFFTRISDWVKNYGYAYRLMAIGIVVAATIVISFVVHYATMVSPDYVVVATTADDNLVPSQYGAIRTQLEQYGDDLNGDGKVVVELVYATLYGNVNNANAYAAERTVLSTEMNGDRWGIVVFDENAYHEMVKSSLLEEGAYQNENGEITAWNWEGSRFYQEVMEISETDASLYFAVRNVPEGASEKVRQAAENGRTLLERVAAGTKTAQDAADK